MKKYSATPRIASTAVLLDLNSHQQLPPEVSYNARKWFAKSEFHVTLIGWGHKVIERLIAERSMTEQAARDLFRKAAEAGTQGFGFAVSLNPCLFHVIKNYSGPDVHSHVRESIIAFTTMVGAAEFFERFVEVTELSFEPVPYHLTLFTLGDEMSRKGIGLTTAKEATHYSQPIAPSDITPEIWVS